MVPVPGSCSLRRLLVALVVLLACGITPKAAAGQSSHPPTNNFNLAFRLAVERADAAQAAYRIERQTPASRDKRLQSRTAYRTLSAPAALALAQTTFPGLMTAPVFDGFAAPPGYSLKGYLSDRDAQITDPTGRPLLSHSSLPIRVEGADGSKRPVRLPLRALAGGFESERPLVPVRYPDRADEPVVLTEDSVSVTAEDATDVKGVLSENRVFFPDVATSVDQVLAPLHQGFSIRWQLRGSDSPNVLPLRISMPAGASARLVGEGDASDLNAPLAVKIAKGSQIIARIAPPLATDADGQSVPTRYELDGTRLLIHVDHTGRDVAWPVLVDPDVESWNSGDLGADGNWTSSEDRLGCTIWPFTFSRNNGLQVGALAGGNYCQWASAGWSWQAPVDATVEYAYFGSLNHDAERSSVTTGIYRPGVWEAGPGLYPDSFVNGYSGHTAPNPTDQNRAFFGIRIDAAGTRSRHVFAHMGFTTLHLGDRWAPSFTAVGLPPNVGQWTNATRTSVALAMADRGLGILDYGVVRKGATPEQDSFRSLIMSFVCPTRYSWCDKTRDTYQFADDPSVSENTAGRLPYDLTDEGVIEFRARVDQAAGGLPVYSDPWKTMVDRSAPVVGSVSGSLKAKQNGFVTAGPYTVTASATDGSRASDATKRSGVRSLAVLVNGQEVQRSPEQACDATLSSCPYPEHTFNLTDADLGGDGLKEIAVIGYDQLGNASDAAANKFSVSVDRTVPDVFLNGPLAMADGGLIAEATYELSIEAEDGESGIQRVGIEVDGDPVPGPTGACPVDDECLWTFSINSYTDGPHSVTVTAYDRSGRTDSETINVDVRKIPTLPASSRDVTSTAGLRVIGAAAGDRLGAAVSGIGDINGDGLDDYAFGAPQAAGGAAGERLLSGVTWVVFGGQTGTLDLASGITGKGMKISGAAPGDASGSSLAPAGDFNGDGIADFMIGAPGSLNPGGGIPGITGLQGKVHVVLGSPGLPAALDLSAASTQVVTINGPALVGLELTPYESFGARLSGVRASEINPATDVNGDGRDDIVIGSPAETIGTDGPARAGRAYVIFGKTDSAAVDVSSLGSGGFAIRGAAQDDRAGSSAVVIGDTNEDGFAEVAVGAPGVASGNGVGYVVFGRTSTSSVNLATTDGSYFRVHGASAERLGSGTSAVSDLDGDGLPDVAFTGQQGARVVYARPTDARDLTPGTIRFGIDVLTLGASGGLNDVQSAGDLNGDHALDLVASRVSAGAATLYSQVGRDERFGTAPDLGSLSGERGTTLLGFDSTSSPPVSAYERDEDGSAGVLVGAPDEDGNGRTNSGSAYAEPSPAPAQISAACTSRNGFAFSTINNLRQCRLAEVGNRDITRRTRKETCVTAIQNVCDERYERPGNEGNGGRAGKSGRLRKALRTATDQNGGVLIAGSTYAWVLKDSLGEVIGYVRHVGGSRNNLAFYNESKALIGETFWSDPSKRAASSVKVQVESRPCANLPTKAFSTSRYRNLSNDRYLSSFYLTCSGSMYRKRIAGSPAPVYKPPQWVPWAADWDQKSTTQPSPNGDAYLSFAGGVGCNLNHNDPPEEKGEKDPNCGAPYLNYSFPIDQQAAAPDYQPVAMVTGSTTGVRGGPYGGGGVTRAVLRTGASGMALRMWDRMTYLDPNVPCGNKPVANWALVRFGSTSRLTYGWVPRRAGDPGLSAGLEQPGSPRTLGCS